MNLKKIYVAQVDEEDCGVAALSMILRNYGSHLSLASLRQYTKTTNEGTTALGIKKAAEHFKINVQAVRANMDLFSMSNIEFPFIVHVIKNQNLEHYYVVLKADSGTIQIADPDPDVGIIKMSYDQFKQEWTGIALFFTPSSYYNPVNDKQDKSLLQFLPLIFKQKKLIINIILAAILVTLISIIGSYFLQVLIDVYIPNNMINTISTMSIGLAVAYIFESIYSYAENFMLTILSQKLSIDVILGYIRHIFELPMSFFSTRKTGDIVSRFDDASNIIDALASSIMSVGLDLTVAIIMAIVLILQNSTLFLITLSAIPIYLIIIVAFNKPFSNLEKKQMESGAMLDSSIIEDLHGIETIKSLSCEMKSYRKVDHEFIDLLKKNLQYTKVNLLQQGLKLVLQLGLSVFVLWVGSNLVVKQVLTVGQLIAFNALLTYFTNPLQNIIDLQPKIKTAEVANNRLNEILQIKSEFLDKRIVTREISKKEQIVLKNVSYSYDYGDRVLNDINLTIKKNDKIAIVGMSGSGKSTLVKLLVNFYDITDGNILINEENITKIDKKTLRQYIVYIPQDPFVFSGTILENLQLGNRPDINYSDISEACRIAQIKDDIESMPLQYHTKLDENGAGLSGGQKQRLTIARALLSPAQVLIFDESTSNLDALTEANLVNELLKLHKTVIFIAHRLSIARKTNNIVVLKKGRIVEKGSHCKLLTEKGEYYRLLNATGDLNE